MSFDPGYTLSSSMQGFAAANSLVPSIDLTPGVYNGGLLSLLDEELANSALSGWRWLLGEDAIALASSGIGDIFFWSHKHNGVYFLESQRGSSLLIEEDVSNFFKKFLPLKGVRHQVLLEDLIIKLRGRLGELSPGECFIAEPWPMLGGSGAESTYAKGSLAVYLNLVGQTVKKSMEKRRKEQLRAS